MKNVPVSERLKHVPHAVLFDLDNTLYAYEHPHEQAIQAVFKKMVHSFSITFNQCEKIFDQAREEVKKQLSNTASSHSRLLYFQKMLEMMGLGTQVVLTLDFEQTYWRTFLSHIVVFDGVRDLLNDMRLMGIPAAVVTDLTVQIQFRKLAYLGLESFFDYVVTSEEAGYDKPHASVFKMAVDKIHPKGDCIWMVGDHPHRDMYGARMALNAVCFQKIHEGVKMGEGDMKADISFKEFSYVNRMLRNLYEERAT